MKPGLRRSLSSSPGRRAAIAAASLAVLFAAYFPALREGGFLWDDNLYLTANPALERGWAGLREIWFKPSASPQYYPLVFTGFALERRLWGLDPSGFRIVNLLLHALTAGLLFRALRLLGAPGAGLAALVFLLHPAQVESVAWIAERKDVLSGAFAMLTAVLWIGWMNTGSERRYAAAVLAFVLAVLSKAYVAPLAVALILLKRRRSPGRFLADALRAAPLAGAAFAVGLIHLAVEKRNVSGWHAEIELSIPARIAAALRALCFYPGKLLWPSELMAVYPKWSAAGTALFAAGAAAALILAFRRMPKGGAKSAAGFWGVYYLLMLAPGLNLVPNAFMRYAYVNDHLDYLACAGPIALFARGWAALVRRTGGGGRGDWPQKAAKGAKRAQKRGMEGMDSFRRRAAVRDPTGHWESSGALAFAALLLAAAALTTFRHSAQYRDSVSLWAANAAKNPGSWAARGHLAAALGEAGEWAEAERLHRAALALHPGFETSWLGLGFALERQGRTEEALEAYDRAAALAPEYAAAHANRGALLEATGRSAEAAEAFRRAAAIRPEDPEFRSMLGAALTSLGRAEEARRELERAIELDPRHSGAWNNLGVLEAGLSRLREAREAFARAAEADPGNEDALRNLAEAERILNAGR